MLVASTSVRIERSFSASACCPSRSIFIVSLWYADALSASVRVKANAVPIPQLTEFGTSRAGRAAGAARNCRRRRQPAAACRRALGRQAGAAAGQGFRRITGTPLASGRATGNGVAAATATRRTRKRRRPRAVRHPGTIAGHEEAAMQNARTLTAATENRRGWPALAALVLGLCAAAAGAADWQPVESIRETAARHAAEQLGADGDDIRVEAGELDSRLRMNRCDA